MVSKLIPAKINSCVKGVKEKMSNEMQFDLLKFY